MKPEKLFIEPAVETTVTLTRLQAANDAHSQAVVDLHDLRCAQQGLRSRINDLGAAIKDLNQKASKQPSMASLSIDQIRALSAEKAATYAEISGLQSAYDLGEQELRDMISDERGLRMLVQDTKTGAWLALYENLLKSIDPDVITKVAACGFMAGKQRSVICDDLLGDDLLDANLVEGLATVFGMPL